MHGIIFSELRNYAESKHGSGTWNALLKQAGLANRVYMAVQEYPDAEVTALVSAASGLSGKPVATVLEDFGEFMVPSLMKMYGHLLAPGWKTIDVIDNTEGAIHTVVRVKSPGAKPPQLTTQRTGPREVLLVYASPRKMCALAIGIGKGLAEWFHESLTVEQKMCMHKGAPRCEILFKTR